MRIKSLFLAATLGLGALSLPATAMAEEVFDAPVATRQANERGLQTAIFAGGCFWGIEGVFSHVRGVTSAVSGYHGGSANTATYRQVSAGGTSHAEAVRVTYDPSVVRYDQLLQILFSVGADPTLVNRQGPDRGSQYRSAIVPVTAEQRAVAQAYVRQMGASGVWRSPIAARVESYQRFYPAEADHQDYMLNNPTSGYIRRWDAPKVAALRTQFPSLYRERFRTG
ncbi:peptide-methionine (S)-S-oxide reductase MsrA [Erythrobacter arachoides]|uniref:Peptide methionine sulfoxide reductase MsrA n=1 Tax=Aurantiacibacter arachoides TaxID=1850444 RepID=A0A845A571_9SPHN|nr:peptide-methionine (S)-S-oxide reductase MsrA [Aurantiacibacter arachoides]MXO94562.1 peptide-methionine (S)-S-oxide reductase MsrA [Aurantiacibacter arachoides]GGD62505.1 peptide methionine sulfoxide reductase MsrA [Aurantiacibacter arachoides]